MPKSESRPNSIVVKFVEEPFMAPEMETPQTFVKEAESPATSGCATPNLFGNVDEATQYNAVHGAPCQLWVPCLVLPAFPEVQQDQKVQKTGDNTPTDLGTFEQSQRLWQASCRPSVQPQLAPPEIVAESAEQQREALRAQHQQVLLALEPVVAERAAEDAKEAKEAEPALEHVEPQTPQAEPVEVPSVLSSGSELPRASSTLNGKAPKFRPGMEECPFVAMGLSCRTSEFSWAGRCQSYLEGKCTRTSSCRFCHCTELQAQWASWSMWSTDAGHFNV